MRSRTRWLRGILTLALVAAMLAAVPAQAEHDEDDHSPTVKLLKRTPIEVGKDLFAQGSDLAFQGNLIVAGTYQGTSFFKILPKAPFVKQIGFHDCPSSQGDVSVWGDFAVVSIDTPASNNVENGVCNNTDESKGKEGVRILDISDPTRPRQIKFVETQCGSHTHVLVPDGAKTYIYVNSYPIQQSATCNQVNHQRFSIIEMPTADPTKAKVSGFMSVPQPSIGCHDTTVFPERDIAVAACLQNTNVLDISNPAEPKVLSTIVNESIQFHHSSSFTWDGKYIIISDEYAGAAGGGGCTGDQDSKVGAMYFYNIEDPENPVLEGDYSLPRVPPADDGAEAERFRCTTHLYNILPMRDPTRYIAVASYYAGGLSVVDFTDPANPEEIGHYLNAPKGQLPDTWSAYWYNNRIYTNDYLSKHGIRVFKMKGLGKRKVRSFATRYNPQIQIESFKN